MKKMLLSVVVLSFLWTNESEAKTIKVSATITSRCAPKNATIVIPKGKKANGFRIGRLDNGHKCKIGGKPDSKGWGIKQGFKTLYYWSRFKNKKPHEKGGPLNKLQLGPGRYHIFVNGGRGAIAQVQYNLN